MLKNFLGFFCGEFDQRNRDFFIGVNTVIFATLSGAGGVRAGASWSGIRGRPGGAFPGLGWAGAAAGKGSFRKGVRGVWRALPEADDQALWSVGADAGQDGAACQGARVGRRVERRAGGCGCAFRSRSGYGGAVGREAQAGLGVGVDAGVGEGRAGVWDADSGGAPDAGPDERTRSDLSVWSGSAEAGVCGAEDTDGVSGLRGATGDGAGQMAEDAD